MKSKKHFFIKIINLYKDKSNLRKAIVKLLKIFQIKEIVLIY